MKILAILLISFVDMIGFFLARIPHSWFLKIIYFIAFLMRKLDKRRFKDALTNLDFVFKDSLSAEEKNKIVIQGYRNFAFVLLEGIRVCFISKKKYESRFEIIDEKYLLDSLEQNKSAILVSGHFGYWEAMATILPQRYAWLNLASLGRLTDYDIINQLIIKRREAKGVKLIDKKGAFRHLLKMYSQGNAMAGILIDQNISIDEGVWVEFFGKKSTHTSIASILSRRFNIDIVPVFIDFNEDYTHFKVKFYPPIKTKNTQNMQKDILEATQLQADITQEVITKHPSSWFWFHKRWKSAYGEIYYR